MSEDLKRKLWIGDLLYEEGSKIPFIQVPPDKDMPDMLHVYEYKQTGEFSPGPEGEEVPHMDVFIHQYIDQEALQAVLDEETVNRVRIYCGLKPLQEAKEKGQEITDKVQQNVTDLERHAQKENSTEEKKIH